MKRTIKVLLVIIVGSFIIGSSINIVSPYRATIVKKEGGGPQEGYHSEYLDICR